MANKSILLGLNPLADLILSEKKQDSAQGLDFYRLYNIRVSSKTYLDLHILINKPINDPDQLKLIRNGHRKGRNLKTI